MRPGPFRVALVLIAAPARADALLDRLVCRCARRPVGPDDFAWTRAVRTEQRSSEKVETRTLVGRYDPAGPRASAGR